MYVSDTKRRFEKTYVISLLGALDLVGKQSA